MLRRFNRIRFSLYVSGVVITAVWLFYRLIVHPRPSLLSCFGPMLVVCVLYAISGLAASKELNDAIAQLHMRCDPLPLLNICTAQLKEIHAGLTQPYMLFLQLNHIVALSSLGRAEEAVAEMDRFLPMIPTKKGQISQVMMISRLNHTAFLLNRGHYVQAERELRELTELLDSDAFPASIRPLFARHLELYRCDLAVARGEFEGGLLEGRLLSLLGCAPYLFARVNSAHQLAEYYLATGQQDKAVEWFRYVADHGGNLGIRTKAKEHLQTEPWNIV